MNTVPLASRLVGLLHGHHVEAEIRDDMVYLPVVDRWANLWMWRTESGSFLMEVRATGADEQVVADRWAALGADAETAIRDGLESFCRCGFHVLLAALWGVLETDQVDHEERWIADQQWDLYLGPYTTRVSPDTPTLVAPAGFVDRVLAALGEHLLDGETHLLRVYVAVLNGAVTVEGVVDDQTSAALGRALSTAAWAFPPTGFASLRWIVAARRRRGSTANLMVRTCGAG